ncbi:hypothetical protein KJ766_01200 [Patescibacteria group bacterium]|nr:hypothetical protein [Patescibacteria group bacterium]
MSIQNSKNEIPGYSGGFKQNQETGEIETGEYSFFIEEAEKLLQTINKLEQAIEDKIKQNLSERRGENAETLQEMLDELHDAEDLVQTWRTTDERKQRLIDFIEQQKIELKKTGEKLGLPELITEIENLKGQIRLLLLTDTQAESVLRRVPPEAMVDHDV